MTNTHGASNYHSRCKTKKTLQGFQTPTQVLALSLSLRNRTGGNRKVKKAVGRDKDRGITYQLLSQAKQT